MYQVLPFPRCEARINITFLGASKTDIYSKQIDSQTFSYLPPIKSSVKFIPIKTTTNNVKARASVRAVENNEAIRKISKRR
jgi:hypothetical protein